VVRSGHTTQQAVLDAISYLEFRRVALVLNQNMSVASTGYYGYGEAADAKAGSSK